MDLSSSSFRDRLERALQALSNLRAGASAFSVLALAGLGLLATAQPAAAVPSFARQTGQPCAACHTAFPELTPFGRRFKLDGYTLEGGDGNYPVPVAAMVQSTLTEYLHKLDAPAGAAWSTYFPTVVRDRPSSRATARCVRPSTSTLCRTTCT